MNELKKVKWIKSELTNLILIDYQNKICSDSQFFFVSEKTLFLELQEKGLLKIVSMTNEFVEFVPTKKLGIWQANTEEQKQIFKGLFFSNIPQSDVDECEKV